LSKQEHVSWFCTYTPLEILDAAGLVPMRDFGDASILESADTFLHPAICPYIRACLAAAFKEEGPHHAVFVNSCDGMRRLYDAWKDRFRGDFVYLMDLPRNDGLQGESMLTREYRGLITALERFWDRRIDDQALREASQLREERRSEYLKMAEGKRGEDRLRLAMLMQTQHDTVPRSHAAAAGNGSGGVPILLTGNLLNPAGLVSTLDQAGAGVTWLDLCNGDRGFSSSTMARGEGLDELVASLARGYLDRHPCARMADSGRRYDLLVKKVEETGAQGVIYASLKFCDAYLYDFPRVSERLKREGIPLLRLESDYTDGHVGQLLTRVEAFLEML
jgi:benzoyl-CoA reductase/2-hydroxyglutaryl-CoA dehydratase subunit BcrC/BadD/HgdB